MEDTPGNDGSTIECVVEEAALNSGDKKQEETDIPLCPMRQYIDSVEKLDFLLSYMNFIHI